jgi:hypothetical protein
LLGDPPVLMFDEPVNGQDPDGVRWVRELFRSLAREGRVVFVSSHLKRTDSLDTGVPSGRSRLVGAGHVPVASRPVRSAFYEPAGPHTFVATPATAGPWSVQSQHGGPPSALAARALQRHDPDETQRLARVAVDILRPIPVAKVTLRTRTVRPGRRVSLLEAVMEAGGQEVLHARGWRIAITSGGPGAAAATAVAPGSPGAPAGPPEIPAAQPPSRFPGGHMTGYLDAIDWRFLAGGGFDTPKPATVWTRPRIPLIEGEEPSPMSRALLVADSGSGVSAVLDPVRFLFINVDLTLALQRDPVGEWLLLDAATTLGGRGTGLAETIVSDTGGPCGLALQTLLIAPR